LNRKRVIHGIGRIYLHVFHNETEDRARAREPERGGEGGIKM